MTVCDFQDLLFGLEQLSPTPPFISRGFWQRTFHSQYSAMTHPRELLELLDCRATDELKNRTFTLMSLRRPEIFTEHLKVGEKTM